MAIVAGGQSGRSEGEETRISSFKEEAPVVNAVGMHDDAVLLEAELERTQVRQLFTSLHFTSFLPSEDTSNLVKSAQENNHHSY